jgi:hypothetical protein
MDLSVCRVQRGTAAGGQRGEAERRALWRFDLCPPLHKIVGCASLKRVI